MLFLPQEVIAKKRDGGKLSSDEIRRFIDGFSRGTVSDAQSAAFAMAVYFRDMDIEERVALTEAMRDSGSTLDWSDLDGPVKPAFHALRDTAQPAIRQEFYGA